MGKEGEKCVDESEREQDNKWDKVVVVSMHVVGEGERAVGSTVRYLTSGRR